MFNLPLQFKYLINPLLLIGVVLLLFFCVEPDLLNYQLPLIQQGQYYRLLTGNLLHTNFNHLLLNCAGVVLIWLLHAEHYSSQRYFGILTLCCLGCGIGLWLFSSLDQYVGLSGALHGMIAYGAIKDIQHKDNTGWLLLAGLCAKVAYENIYGASDSVKALIGAEVAVQAHLYGLVSGLLCALTAIKPQQKQDLT